VQEHQRPQHEQKANRVTRSPDLQRWCGHQRASSIVSRARRAARSTR
jgi:hypothetical protein